MEIRIVVDAPKGWKRRVLLFVALPVGLISAAAAVAHATYDTSWIQSGQLISAGQLKADLDDAQNRLVALENRTLGKYDVGAQYCGSTPAHDGNLGGYAGAKAMCQAACGGAETAHMCTNEEVARTLALGITFPSTNSWYSLGFSYYTGGNPLWVDDCKGWTDNTGGSPNQHGAVIANASGPNGPDGCSKSWPVLCCN